MLLNQWLIEGLPEKLLLTASGTRVVWWETVADPGFVQGSKGSKRVKSKTNSVIFQHKKIWEF